jgi:hypothetical protein
MAILWEEEGEEIGRNPEEEPFVYKRFLPRPPSSKKLL